MSDFDLSLIREFRSRPAFYDRNSPLFKDKAFNGQAWQEISNILGYDVALLKDRMLQLRNRYNLEKRRLEQLAEENPGKYASSPWPLYEHLGFLSDHIRSRRSFKRMMPRQASMEYSMSGGGGADCGGGDFGGGGGGGGSSTNMSPRPTLSADYTDSPPTTNGLLTVKLENPGDMETDSQSGTDGAGDEDTNMNTNPTQAVAPAALATSANVSQQHNTNTSTTPLPTLPTIQKSISIRNLDSMRTIIPMHNSHNNNSSNINNNNNNHNNIHRNHNHHHHNDTHHFNRSSNIRSEAIAVVPEKKRCLTAREQKYEAFGQFVASSLGEMPKQQALLLVENFTKEVVRVLIEKNSADTSSSSSTNVLPSSGGGGVTGVSVSGLVNNCSNSCNQKDEMLQISTQQQQQRQAN